jgi:uncharacterized protein (DUF1778 family)
VVTLWVLSKAKEGIDMLKSGFLKLRIDPAEKQAFQEAADLAGVALSVWIRERCRKVARKELEAAGHKIAFLQGQGLH